MSRRLIALFAVAGCSSARPPPPGGDGACTEVATDAPPSRGRVVTLDVAGEWDRHPRHPRIQGLRALLAVYYFAATKDDLRTLTGHLVERCPHGHRGDTARAFPVDCLAVSPITAYCDGLVSPERACNTVRRRPTGRPIASW